MSLYYNYSNSTCPQLYTAAEQTAQADVCCVIHPDSLTAIMAVRTAPQVLALCLIVICAASQLDGELTISDVVLNLSGSSIRFLEVSFHFVCWNNNHCILNSERKETKCCEDIKGNCWPRLDRTKDELLGCQAINISLSCNYFIIE